LLLRDFEMQRVIRNASRSNRTRT